MKYYNISNGWNVNEVHADATRKEEVGVEFLFLFHQILSFLKWVLIDASRIGEPKSCTPNYRSHLYNAFS